MEPAETANRQERSSFPAAFVIGLVVVALLFGGLVLLTRLTKPAGGPQAAQHFPFSAAEQAYSEHIHFKNIQMAQATNFLNQEFTYVAGTISNDGAQTLRGLEVVLEFRDPFNQVILRENQLLIGKGAPPLDGGARRDFQVTLEHVPAEWNQQYPSFRVVGLLLE
jgi:hypothetical protein